jgi:hypothetical protein
MASPKREDGQAGRCPSCGAETGENARFCAQCGARLEARTPSGTVRRRHARLPPRVERSFGVGEPEATIEVLRDGVWIPVESALVNVSRGGMGIVSDEELSPGDRVRATLLVGGPARRAEGSVAYCAPFELFTGLPCFRCGIAFDHLQPRFVHALAGPTHGVGYLVSLGDVAVEQGDLNAAERWYEEGLALAGEMGEQERIPRILESMAIVAALRDDPTRALGLAGSAAAMRDRLGIAATPAQHARIDGALGAVRWNLSDEEYQAAWQAGMRMELAEAVALALAE